ncbi:MAG: lytic transglycosylase domain-containing protein [Candidatus Competibacteraceae bacterium]|nr:lytic transglycosylase domain-containing protein [Candidatus Competibacteraceae bacterium]
MKPPLFVIGLVLASIQQTVVAAALPLAYRTVAADYQVPAEVLYVLAQTASASRLSQGSAQPWPWLITVAGRSERYFSRRAARQALQRYQGQGQQALAAGLLQLDPAQFSEPAAVFDPWRNLRVGAARLKRHYQVQGNWALAAAQFAPSKQTRVASLKHINWHNQRRFAPAVAQIARHHRLEPALLHAVISVESAYRPDATSPAGAQGLMQLMPATARRFGVRDPYQPLANIDGGARYLRRLLDTLQALPLALAAYNAGENAVRRYGYRIPPYRETQAYVPHVLSWYRYFRVREVLG